MPARKKAAKTPLPDNVVEAGNGHHVRIIKAGEADEILTMISQFGAGAISRHEANMRLVLFCAVHPNGEQKFKSRDALNKMPLKEFMALTEVAADLNGLSEKNPVEEAQKN